MRLVLIGAGKGGAALLSTFCEYEDVKVVGVADINGEAEGMQLARSLKIPTTTNFEELISDTEVDLIVNVTGAKSVSEKLRKMVGNNVEIISGNGAKFLWHLVEDRRKKEQETKDRLLEQQTLYTIGLMLSSAERREEALNTIVESAIKLSNAAAGSLVLFDEESGEMVMAHSKGFSPRFSKIKRWKLNTGGITSMILDSKTPVIVSDISKDPFKHNPVILDEGVKSFMAVPLRAEGKIVGILYVNDFKPREFDKSQVSIVSLLSTQATFAIENIMLLEKTEQMAVTDDLTKLYNHRFFVRSLNEEFKRANRYKQNISIVMIDVDYFKHYNDTHGHLKGNDVLKEIAQILKSSIRDIDVVARYGGEEFSIILPQTDKSKGAALTAERIRIAIEGFNFHKREAQPGGRITISVGIAAFPEDGKTISEVVGRADEALYQAKREGRNRVCVYNGVS
ncbi:MAG: diguanylate cyclase [Deltaproteobacteria bacterium]|nr:diguanylate cyclase [Deltaproteobacteria bacterium]